MKKSSSLIGLLNLNGSLYRGVGFHEPYSFSRLTSKNAQDASGNLLGFGEILVEKLRRIKMIHGSLRNFGIHPYLDKLFRKNSGKIL